MKNATFTSFAALLEDIAHAFARTLRYGAHAVATMPWPALLAACLALALVITVLPLALFLFVVFMALKLVAGAIAANAHRRGE